ncbi:MAG: amino acid ABC transporter permease [Opitutales bacterium]
MAGGLTFVLLQFDYRWDWSGVTARAGVFFQGWLLTLAISVVSLLLALLLGVTVALAHRSRVELVRALAKVYVELIRGSPLLVQILFVWYVLFYGASGEWRLPVGVLVLSLFSSAYLSEIIRSGLQSVGDSQWDSARAIGLTTAQTYRHVVVPQALKNILSPLVGQFANLIKDSSLLSIISIGEFTFQAQQIDANTFSPFEAYFPLAIGYLALTLPLSFCSRWLEARAQYAT